MDWLTPFVVGVVSGLALAFIGYRIVRWFRVLPHVVLRALDGNYNAECMRAEETAAPKPVIFHSPRVSTFFNESD